MSTSTPLLERPVPTAADDWPEHHPAAPPFVPAERTQIRPTQIRRTQIRQLVIGLVALPLTALPFFAYTTFTPEGRLVRDRALVASRRRPFPSPPPRRSPPRLRLPPGTRARSWPSPTTGSVRRRTPRAAS